MLLGLMRRRALDTGILLAGLAGSIFLLWHGAVVRRGISAAERWGFWLLLAAAAAACAVAGRRPVGAWPAALAGARRHGSALALAGVLLLFSLPAAHLWSSGRTTYLALGGLLPWSDANAYYVGAHGLLDRRLLDDFSTRRPLNAAFLAVRLFLAGDDLQAVLALQAWLAAAAAFLFARTLARSHGLGSGLLALALLYEFLRPYLGTTMSETLGLTLGCLAFVLLWHAARAHPPPAGWLLVGGAALFGLAQAARPGAYAALPAVLVWAGLSAGRPAVGRRLALAGTGLAAAYALAASPSWWLVSPGGAANANLSYVVYGLAAGGKSWSHALTDNPECQIPREAARARCVDARTFELVRRSPGLLAQGYLGGLKTYPRRVFATLEEAASPLWRWESRRDVKARPVLLALLGLGLLAAAARWRDPRSQLLLCIFTSVLVSAPLLTGVESRVYAATFPFTAALTAASLGLLRRVPGPGVQPSDRSDAVPAGALGLGLTLAAVIGPALVLPFNPWPSFPPRPCGEGLRSIVAGSGHGLVSLRVIPGGPEARTQLPRVSHEDWHADPTFTHGGAERIWSELGPGDRLAFVYDHTWPRPGLPPGAWVVLPPPMELPAPGRFARICAQPDDRTYKGLVWRATRVDPIEPVSP